MALSVVYVKEFGHVVGAVSTAGESMSLDVSALAGAELPLRTALDLGRNATLALKADRLAAAAVDDEPAVFDQHLAFGVEFGPDDKPKSALQGLTDWDGPKLTENSLGITLPEGTYAQPTPVLALITDGQDIRVVAGDVPAGTNPTVELTVSVSKGMHGMLVLVPGLEGRLMAVDVP